MNRWVRRAAIGLAAIAIILLIAFGAVYALSAARLGDAPAVTPHAFDAQRGDAAEGEHLVRVYGCTECHGATLGGSLLIDGMPFARLPAPNLTAGREGGPLTEEQWELAVRHGIGTNGRALYIMPAEYSYLGDQDLADIVAYVRTLPAASDDLPERAFGPVGRALIAFGRFPSAVDLAPGAERHPSMPPKAPTAEFGQYLARLCTGCHGEDLAGAPPMQPDAPPGPNLTPGGNLGRWSYEQFETALRTGRTPEGRMLNPQFMPWTAIGQANETELRAMWAYLTSLAPQPTAASE